MLSDVNITTREIYDEMLAMHTEVRDMRKEVQSISDHEARLRKLEHKMWLATGVAALLGAVLVRVAAVWFGA